MKIAVYTIALNEEKHVKRWFESAKDADLLVIADTGSTDKTRYLAKSLGISVTEIEVKPWRFDVARNASLALIPEDFDICIQLDMDEVLPEGWRKKVEEAFEKGNSWPKYTMVMSRDSSGNPRNYFHHFRIHPRRGFYWKYPIHEVLTHLPELKFERKIIDLEIDHLPDKSKSRKSYLDLLEMAVEEEPKDWRMNHYLNREYFYNRDWLKVLQSAYKCEGILGGWDVERASTYMWASEAAHHLKMPSLAEDWAKKATEAASHFYEVWHWRAHIAHLRGKWIECLDFANKRLSLARQNHHLVKPEVWEWWGYDLIALASHNLGNHFDAVRFGKMAIQGDNFNKRLENNLTYYIKGYDSQINLNCTNLTKLKGFPEVYFINLHESLDRLNNLQTQFDKYGISNVTRISAERSVKREEGDMDTAIRTSHLNALKYFLEQSESRYAIICEDDASFELSDKWSFTWEDVMRRVETNQINILQLTLITSNTGLLLSGLHWRRPGIDWSSAMYLVSRQGAKEILLKSMDESRLIGITESDLFDDLEVFTWALFDCSVNLGSTFHSDHVERYHKPSFDFLRKSFDSCHR